MCPTSILSPSRANAAGSTPARPSKIRQDAIDGEHDVFGDGSVVCLPTYGHTPGHQSLKLRLPGSEIVLAGDACYFCRTLRECRLPRFVHDRKAMLTSLDHLARSTSDWPLKGRGHREPRPASVIQC